MGENRCELCKSFGIKIDPLSKIRKCINIDCKYGYFYVNSREMVKYYSNILYKLLHKVYYNIPEKVYCSPEYKEAWKYFIEEIFYSRSTNDLINLSRLYLYGIGVKRSLFISNAIKSYVDMINLQGEIIDPCPICFSNPTDYGELCSKCSCSICEYCYKKLKNKLCPCCRTPFFLPVKIVFINLIDLITRFRNTDKSNKIKMSFVKFLMTINQNNLAIKFAVELVSRGYEPAISLLSILKNDKELLVIGGCRLERLSLRLLALQHIKSINLFMGKYYYGLAVERGDFRSLIVLDLIS